MQLSRGCLVAAVLIATAASAPAATAPVYWNLFNVEGESDGYAAFVTYATLLDMLNDENRTSQHIADGNAPFGRNIVGSGSDGTTFWNLFNVEGASDGDAAFITYASLLDMLNDENRIAQYIADGNAPFGRNIVGTGALIVPPPIPLPPAVLLLASGIAALGWTARSRRNNLVAG